MQPGSNRKSIRNAARRWIVATCFGASVLSVPPLVARDGDPSPTAAPRPSKSQPRSAASGDIRQPFKQNLAVEPSEKAEPPEKAEMLASAAQATVHVDKANRVELHVTAMPIGDVLRMLADESRRNIVASKGVTGAVTANLYDATLEDALEAILHGNGLGYVQRGDYIYVHTQEELAKMKEAQREVVTRVFRLKYLEAADARALLTPMLSANGKIAMTPASGSGSAAAGGAASGSGGSGGSASGGSAAGGLSGGNEHSDAAALVITDDLERVNKITKVLAELDIRPRQVLIEATILRAALSEDNAMGLDFTTLGGVDFGEVGSTSPAAQSITTGPLAPAELDNTTFTARTTLAGGVPAGGLSFGIIKNNVGVFIRALEQVADTTVIANPKVLALNKQKGEVIVGRRDGYVTTTTTATASIESVEFLETGTQLRFRPFILDDQYVRMEIHPEDSTGGLTASNLPFKQTTEVTTNILVRDGYTILIGGLFREVTTANRSQLPGLGNIPVLGAMFRQTSDTTVREEVIILLTVRVVKGEPEEREGAALGDQIERMRVGMRRGLQPLGRERFAQAHYRWALEHLAKGNLARAQWDAELAMHNAPRFVPAVQLLDQIRGRRMWEEDGSAVRFHLQRMIAADKGVVLPPQGRPAVGQASRLSAQGSGGPSTGGTPVPQGSGGFDEERTVPAAPPEEQRP